MPENGGFLGQKKQFPSGTHFPILLGTWLQHSSTLQGIRDVEVFPSALHADAKLLTVQTLAFGRQPDETIARIWFTQEAREYRAVPTATPPPTPLCHRAARH